MTYLCFECCNVTKGCSFCKRNSCVGSVCLRGESQNTLERANTILRYLTQLRLSLEREIKFYTNMGLTSTSVTLKKEPSLFNKRPRLLAFSPNIIFGKWAKKCKLKHSPHFIKTNNHDDYSRIAKMDATQMNRFIYSYVRLYNGRQVRLWTSLNRSVFILKSNKSISTAKMIVILVISFAIHVIIHAAFAWSSLFFSLLM